MDKTGVESNEKKLEQLDEDTLALLVKKLGVEFIEGIEALTNRKGLSKKEQLILVLDEVNNLEKEYKVVKNKPPIGRFLFH